MFDRIAGVYDALNTVMTAGLHHRWRARAVDLARVGPGSRVLDVATGTGDLAIELAAASAPTARSSAATSPRACSTAPAPRRRGAGSGEPALRMGRRAGPALLRMTASTPPRSASARATSATAARPRRDGARRAPRRPRGRARDNDAHARPAVALLRAVVRPHRARARAPGRRVLATLARRSTAEGTIAQAYTICPTPSSASPTRPRSPPRCSAPGCSEIRYVITAGGIVAIHAGTVPGGAAAEAEVRHHERGEQHAGVPWGRWTGSTRSCAAAARACARGWSAPSATSAR